MKTILRITKTELGLMFYTPIAWLVLTIFVFQSGFGLFNLLHGTLQAQGNGIKLNILTYFIFSRPIYGFFALVVNSLYIYIPLLTMGLISRETSSGSIKLLLSSPVKIREIVLGKFLAMMVYNLLFIVILILFLVLGDVAIISLDVRSLLAGLLGVYLLTCAYAAIGLFMSSLTSYQVVAAISTFVVLGILNFIQLVDQRNAFVRLITYFLSLAGRTNHFNLGLVSSADVFYFLIIIAGFLTFTGLRLYDSRDPKPRFIKVSRYASVGIIMLLLGYTSSRQLLTIYFDMTRVKRNTLSSATQKLIAQFHQPLTITTYANLLDDNFYLTIPEARNNDLDFWQPYFQFMPGLNLKYVYYYAPPANPFLMKLNPHLDLMGVAKKVANSYEFELNYFLSPAQVRRQIDLEPEEYRVVRVISDGHRQAMLRLFAEITDQQPGEQEIAAALKQLLAVPPKVAFVAGNNERNIGKDGDREYKKAVNGLNFRNSLINQGFAVETVTLPDQDIPGGLTALVLADPTTPLAPAAIEKIRKYLDRGGNMLLAGEPGRQNLVNPLLASLGVKLKAGVLIQESKGDSPDHIVADFNKNAVTLSANLKTFWKDSVKLTTIGAAGLQILPGSNYKIDTIVSTQAADTWNKMGSFEMDTGKVGYEPAHGDEHQAIPLALALSRQIGHRSQKIMIVGDADFMSNRFDRTRFSPDGAFVLGMFNWFSDGQFPVFITPTESPDNRLRISFGDLSCFKLIFLGLLPFLLMVSGAGLLIYRSRK